MSILDQLVTLVSHLLFIAVSYHLIVYLFDWHKMIKMTPDNLIRLKIFILFLSIALGFLVSSFFQGVIQASQAIFFALN